MSMTANKRECLERSAYRIRRRIIETIVKHGEGHAGSALSCADILAVLYMDVMQLDPAQPTQAWSDKFLLSAGHKCLALYAALAERGIISEETLDRYNQLHTPVPGHPDMSKLAGVQFSSGSLGHGLPIGCGLALGARLNGFDCRTFVLMGDGEQGEGTNWEAAGFAAQHHLDRMTAILDNNGLQINGTVGEVLYPGDYASRYAAFGWAVREVDGHSVEALDEALRAAPFEKGKPSLLVAKTIKGKGLSFAENNAAYHHWNPNEEEKRLALAGLDAYAAAHGYGNPEGEERG